MREFVREHPWVTNCMRDCRISTISDQNDLTYLFRSDEKDAEQELDMEEEQEEQEEDEWEQEY